MKKKNFERKYELQKTVIAHQTKQVSLLKEQVEKLKQEIEEKNELINSIEPLKIELADNIAEHKRLREQYNKLIEDLKKMKEIMNQEVYRGRWRLIRFLIK